MQKRKTSTKKIVKVKESTGEVVKSPVDIDDESRDILHPKYGELVEQMVQINSRLITKSMEATVYRFAAVKAFIEMRQRITNRYTRNSRTIRLEVLNELEELYKKILEDNKVSLESPELPEEDECFQDEEWTPVEENANPFEEDK